ncbi:hypothetical protein D1AOALGA4SA_6705 [Olavius algarvensis Delta 1 endosymbiont]|nr:hypothetical protein D1AOALGA4SA_6705 [Olavius algarvensis Delta 1 endosymbiont]
MKSKSGKYNMLNKKSICLPLILIFSICLFTANAFAGGCNGGQDCLKCGQMAHPQATGPASGILPSNCQADFPNSDCGITANRIFDNQSILISAARVDNHNESSTPVGLAVDQYRDSFLQKTISSISTKAVTTSPPIYLRNLSLLC